MALELIYTSAPKGLKQGTSGYCTVACTSGMPPPYIDLLENLSGYKALFDSDSPEASRNPVSYSHYRLRAGGKTLSVLSRVTSYGFDYTGRTNKIGYHVVVEPNEQIEAGPAALLLKSGFMLTHWQGEAQFISRPKLIPSISPQRGPASHWERLAGDAGWAGVLAEGFSGPESPPVYMIFEPGIDVLPLLNEASLILRPELRWHLTFNTYLTTLPTNSSCHWRCCLPNSPVLAEAKRTRNALIIDLRRGRELGVPKAAEEYLEAARSGKALAAPIPRKAVAARTSSASDESDFEIRILGEEEDQERPVRSNAPLVAHPGARSAEPRLPRFALPAVASVVIGIGIIIAMVLGLTPGKESPLISHGPAAQPDAGGVGIGPQPDNRPAKLADPKGDESKKEMPDKVMGHPRNDVPAKPEPKREAAKPEPERPKEGGKKEGPITPPQKAEEPNRHIETVVVLLIDKKGMPESFRGSPKEPKERIRIPKVPPLGTSLSLELGWKPPQDMATDNPAGTHIQVSGTNPNDKSKTKLFMATLSGNDLVWEKQDGVDSDWKKLQQSANYLSISEENTERYRCYFRPVQGSNKNAIPIPVSFQEDGAPQEPRSPVQLLVREFLKSIERFPGGVDAISLPQIDDTTQVDVLDGKLEDKDVRTDVKASISKQGDIQLKWPEPKVDKLKALHKLRDLFRKEPPKDEKAYGEFLKHVESNSQSRELDIPNWKKEMLGLYEKIKTLKEADKLKPIQDNLNKSFKRIPDECDHRINALREELFRPYKLKLYLTPERKLFLTIYVQPKKNN